MTTLFCVYMFVSDSWTSYYCMPVRVPGVKFLIAHFCIFSSQHMWRLHHVWWHVTPEGSVLWPVTCSGPMCFPNVDMCHDQGTDSNAPIQLDRNICLLSKSVKHNRQTMPHSFDSVIDNVVTLILTTKCSFYRAMHFSAKRGIAIAWRLSVRLSVCNVGELWSHRLEFFENNFIIS